ncbi:MAG TPA: hypothetical protein VHE61_16755 [Opitutaceae bacterium]|nr:hypothetical protein [Opitutaceae bacterium]
MKTLVKVSLLVAGMIGAAAPLTFAVDAPTAPAAAAPAVAPAHPRHHARALRRMMIRRHLARKLGLSTDQIAKLKTTRTNTVASIKSIRADTTLTPDQKKAKIRDVVRAARQSAQGILTAEQKAKLDTMRRNFRHAYGV